MTNQEVLARTIWGEARGEGHAGMVAVACVVRNRVRNPRWWGETWPTVCWRHAQFSCWNSADPNFHEMRAVTEADPAYADALTIAAGIISGEIEDVTRNADAYADLAVCDPAWFDASKITVRIGRHTFFRLELRAA